MNIEVSVGIVALNFADQLTVVHGHEMYLMLLAGPVLNLDQRFAIPPTGRVSQRKAVTAPFRLEMWILNEWSYPC